MKYQVQFSEAPGTVQHRSVKVQLIQLQVHVLN